jgi:hypothetical protein
LRVVRTIAALVATCLLACVMLSEQFSEAYAQQPTQAQPTEPRLMVPSDDVLLIMIRAMLIAVDQANVTGNYNVLRDMAAPGFREANSTDKLAQIFAKLRQRKLDLNPILVIQPKLYRKPEITSQGLLRITGFFPTDPERINFDLLFQPVHGQWRLFGILVNTTPSQPASVLEVVPAAPVEAPAAAAPAKPAASSPQTPNATKPSNTAKKGPSETDQDIRDRLDNPPSPPPEDEQPKERSFWNPFDR